MYSKTVLFCFAGCVLATVFTPGLAKVLKAKGKLACGKYAKDRPAEMTVILNLRGEGTCNKEVQVSSNGMDFKLTLNSAQLTTNIAYLEVTYRCKTADKSLTLVIGIKPAFFCESESGCAEYDVGIVNLKSSLFKNCKEERSGLDFRDCFKLVTSEGYVRHNDSSESVESEEALTTPLRA